MMDLLIMFAMFIASAGVIVSLVLLLRNQPPEGRRISTRNFIILIIVYATVMSGFAVIYMGLELLGQSVLVEGETLEFTSLGHLIEDVMYFSAVTMLTVGYGDITPQGIGRWVAMVQALIGYLLPVAFVVTTVIYSEERKLPKTERL
ncbi:potassium channel family protein [Litchfieldia alkalitelluris]|uniref:Potassium channel family protein n=2 Tax=Evansella alkalicola TaxID=745819 RepID=A0ABS6JN38_9BACI|nr:potassium channel family protein [Litchfieldia alkalitelluris]MBU9719830.1 potassium channel family protein [Bacillus alkalicola]